MAEHLDGLRLTQLPVELDYEPLIPPKALAQDGFGQPGGPNDDREGWRAFPSKTRQNRLKLTPMKPARYLGAYGHAATTTHQYRSQHPARKIPQPYEFDPGHADGIRHADLDAGVRGLNELIFECQWSLEGIEHAKLDLEALGWARARGLRE